MLNHITIMGRLTRDPELKTTNSGIPVVSFSIAVDRDFADKESGERGVDFIDVTAWRNTAEFVSRYFTKGRMAVVSGRLQTRNWTDKDGNKRKAVEIVADNVYFGDSKRNDSETVGEIARPYVGGGRLANDAEMKNLADFAPIESEDEGLPF